jgi:ATP-binding cassette subfamily F protein uup
LVFEAKHVTHSFGAAPIIRDFSARIQRRDRIGIIGPNGCGKTTLIKLLVGELEPTSGLIKRGTNLLPAYFDQQREQLDPGASIMDNVTGGSGDTVTIDGQARHVSGYLRDFLFPPERLRAPVSMLSGGERNRLLLARLFARPSNLLVMDEPTNDLDAETLELLEEMVADYAGTLLLVSHDRAFLDNVVTSTLVFEGDGQINEYVGGYTDWLRQPKVAAAAASTAAAKPTAAAGSRGAAGSTGAAPKLKRLSYNEQRELAQLPEKIQRLETEQAQLNALISDPAAFQRNKDESNLALQRLQALAAELETAYSRWDTLDSSATGNTQTGS